MSAEVLREAAALMRERAEAATPGPWFVPDADDEYVGPADVVGDGEPGERYIICEHAGCDATHIASWDPAVALAVAKLLDDTAETWEMCDLDALFRRSAHTIAVTYTRDHALAVARAYLGVSS